MFCFYFAHINVRANGFSTGPTLEERIVFEVFWNLNSSTMNWHLFADVSFTFFRI